jgi:S-adenosylmethionine:tRNA ribosyltransferase-isomerase
MRVSDFDFDLPEELVAQEPAPERDRSRLLVVDRAAGTLTDAVFGEIGRWLGAGDLLVVNDTRVFPARLVGRREPSGGRVELFLVREEGGGVWEALARPAARLRPGDLVAFGEGKERIEADVVDRRDGGRRAVRFRDYERFWERLELWGRTPLPPYIRRGESEDARLDRDRYQTVYARERGAIAAPTAGLHFTPGLLDALEAKGVERTAVTLHVGYGTFQPVRVEVVEEHRVEPELYEVGAGAAAAVTRAKAEGRRVVAVGTTTTRALESATDEAGRLSPGRGVADLFIYPGYTFRAVDALVTNFHLPRSSLLMLVAAFAGRELVLEAYRHAVRERYRFYSYGDAMLVV